jgi:hypothetical protein
MDDDAAANPAEPAPTAHDVPWDDVAARTAQRASLLAFASEVEAEHGPPSDDLLRTIEAKARAWRE